MKTLYMIGGPMGVGKTTAAQTLKELLPCSVFLDGDWCWDMHPWQDTPETRQMVLDNIVYLLNNFLACSAYQHILFCWVLHQQQTIDLLLARLQASMQAQSVRYKGVSLVCSPDVLRQRLQQDIALGRRDSAVLVRSLERLSCYAALSVPQLDVSLLSPLETAQAILSL